MKVDTTEIHEDTNLTIPEPIEKKLKIAKGMILLSAGAYLFSAISSVIQIQALNKSFTGDIAGLGIDPIGFSSAFSLQSLIVLGLSVYALKEINRNAWGWVAALSLLGMNLTTWAFPFSIIGLLVLLDKDVRGFFFKQLDVSF